MNSVDPWKEKLRLLLKLAVPGLTAVSILASGIWTLSVTLGDLREEIAVIRQELKTINNTHELRISKLEGQIVSVGDCQAELNLLKEETLELQRTVYISLGELKARQESNEP